MTSNTHQTNDVLTAPPEAVASEGFKSQSYFSSLGEIAGLGSDAGSCGSVRKYYRAAGKR